MVRGKPLNETILFHIPVTLSKPYNVRDTCLYNHFQLDLSYVSWYNTIMPARITKTSVLSGVTRTYEMKRYTQEEFDRAYNAYMRGEVADITTLLPDLTDKAIEFIRSGTLPEEW